MLNTELIPAAEADSKWLMVVLHGLGDSMEGFRWLPSALNNPRLNILLANAPDDYHGGFSWYNIYDKPGIGVERSRRLLFDLLDRQRADGFATESALAMVPIEFIEELKARLWILTFSHDHYENRRAICSAKSTAPHNALCVSLSTYCGVRFVQYHTGPGLAKDYT